MHKKENFIFVEVLFYHLLTFSNRYEISLLQFVAFVSRFHYLFIILMSWLFILFFRFLSETSNLRIEGSLDSDQRRFTPDDT